MQQGSPNPRPRPVPEIPRGFSGRGISCLASGILGGGGQYMAMFIRGRARIGTAWNSWQDFGYPNFFHRMEDEEFVSAAEAELAGGMQENQVEK